MANSSWNIYNFRMPLIEKLLAKGNEIIVVAPVDEYINYLQELEGVRHVPLKSLSRRSLNPLGSLQLIMELFRIYKRERPDLLIHYTHKPNIFGGVPAWMLGIKSIAVVTGLGYAFIREGWLNRMTRVLYRLASRFHNKIIFENVDDLQYFVSEKISKEHKLTSVEGCGVDAQYYHPRENKEGGKTVFCFIGRLLYDKGIREFVEAGKIMLSENSDLEFWLIGDLDAGNPSMIEKEVLLSWVEDKSVRYFGFVDDLRPLIAQSSCIVLPSYREGMPRSVLEAMAMAKPVIVSDVPGCRQTVVHERSGYLVKARSVESLVAAMRKFVGLSYRNRQIMGDYGRKLVMDKFNKQKISEDLYQIISQVYFCDK